MRFVNSPYTVCFLPCLPGFFFVPTLCGIFVRCESSQAKREIGRLSTLDG